MTRKTKEKEYVKVKKRGQRQKIMAVDEAASNYKNTKIVEPKINFL
jgi:hypothetical protein